MKTHAIVAFGFVLTVLCSQTAKAGMTVNGYSAATADRYDRFNNSAAFNGNPHDWSGVGGRLPGDGGR